MQVRYVNVNGQLRQEIVGGGTGAGGASTGAVPGVAPGVRPQTLGNILASRDPRAAAAASAGVPDAAGGGSKPLGAMYIVQHPLMPGQQPPGLPPGLRPGQIINFPQAVTAGPGVPIGQAGRAGSLQVQGGGEACGQLSEGGLPSPRGAAAAGLPPLKTEVGLADGCVCMMST
jgi:hypothetical protein